MAKSNKNLNVGVFALELVGSLFFLYLVYLMAANLMPISIVFNGTGAFWLPVFVGVSILASIALFIFSFSYLGEPKIRAGIRTKNLGLSLAVVAGITFFALTIGTPYFFVALGGFVLSVIGGMAGYRP